MFTYDYDLPNETAYAETCAAISLVFLSLNLGSGAATPAAKGEDASAVARHIDQLGDEDRWPLRRLGAAGDLPGGVA